MNDLGPEATLLLAASHSPKGTASPQTVLLIKKPKSGSLSAEDKHNNGQLAKLQIRVEQVTRSLKVFKIVSERYRNWRKRLHLRFSLIASIYNFE